MITPWFDETGKSKKGNEKGKNTGAKKPRTL